MGLVWLGRVVLGGVGGGYMMLVATDLQASIHPRDLSCFDQA